MIPDATNAATTTNASTSITMLRMGELFFSATSGLASRC
jgi:hypothetical protein